jgi:hypothetical protein
MDASEHGQAVHRKLSFYELFDHVPGSGFIVVDGDQEDLLAPAGNSVFRHGDFLSNARAKKNLTHGFPMNSFGGFQ